MTAASHDAIRRAWRNAAPDATDTEIDDLVAAFNPLDIPVRRMLAAYRAGLARAQTDAQADACPGCCVCDGPL